MAVQSRASQHSLDARKILVCHWTSTTTVGTVSSHHFSSSFWDTKIVVTPMALPPFLSCPWTPSTMLPSPCPLAHDLCRPSFPVSHHPPALLCPVKCHILVFLSLFFFRIFYDLSHCFASKHIMEPHACPRFTYASITSIYNTSSQWNE